MSTKPTIKRVSADARGEIYSIELPGTNRELMLLHSKAGVLRGGHSHDCPESVMMLKGKMRYRKMRYPERTWPPEEFREDGWKPPERQPAILRDGDTSWNDAWQPHMAEFLEDSWVIEWKVCKNKNSWKNENYAPWRKMVDANVK